MLKKVTVFAVLLTFLTVGVAWAADPATKPQAVCPVMGGNINKDVYLDYQGQRIYFCCPACIEVFKKNPEKYLQKLKEQGVTPEKSPSAR